MIAAKNNNGSILPDSVFCIPLTLRWITLILMNVVNSVSGPEGLTEYEELPGVHKQEFKIPECRKTRPVFPGFTERGFRFRTLFDGSRHMVSRNRATCWLKFRSAIVIQGTGTRL